MSFLAVIDHQHILQVPLPGHRWETGEADKELEKKSQ
jgi:hypothetical protein